MPRRFHIVDVFARQRYAGNQLAVVTDAEDLSTEEMQAIAGEMDYSETTFVTGPPADGAWPVRIFTPNAEVPFAGHPTLGTAQVVREQLAEGTPKTVTLDLEVGEVPVVVNEDASVDGGETRETLWMTQQTPTFGDRLAHPDLADVLGLPVEALDDEWPVQVVSTGLPTVVVSLADRDALTSVDLDRAAYDRVTGDREAKNVLAFCADPRDGANDLADRVFAPFYDVPEDPATGSSNGCLAAYLARHEYFGDSAIDARVEQGYEMGRPSLLHLRADANDDVHVEVGGSVIPVARGELI
ncbi:PhzF family phenazine biosynthesis protein [Haloarcula nitratireducens]|uniref:PhzF family phenazine biosynthesis protein n=1 Tax=Haloarcula nitratireducens TaxID=2487749 RepID=A0AAW4PEQ0_9EURY|nr:PhzF family phenazine biosynthesis protein [Halomicroarcula nitratireducens]MBX0296065.1 PhzF family phenazine biosynthesis protein [Halomicroarcula nitratireducens]